MKRRMTECAIKLALTAVLALAIPTFQGCMDHAIGNDGDSAAAEGAEPDAQKEPSRFSPASMAIATRRLPGRALTGEIICISPVFDPDTGLVEVREGVVTGETVVTSGKGSVSDQARVEIIATDHQPRIRAVGLALAGKLIPGSHRG